MKNLPKISIVIPSFNKVRFIEETLQSIFKQEYPSLEVIIQDGESTDGTVNVIKRFAKKYSGIKWESEKDNGQLEAINKGLKKAIGEVVTYINADDVYKNGALLTVGKYFSKNPDTLWLAGRGDVIDEGGREISRLVTGYKNLLLAINRYSLLLVVNYLMQPSVFLARGTYEKYGPFTGSKVGVMEYELWLKLGMVKMPAVLDSYLSSFRLAGGTISSTEFKKVLLLDEKIAEKYTKNPLVLLMHRLHNLGRVATIKGLTD